MSTLAAVEQNIKATNWTNTLRDFATPVATNLILPYPPSVNELFAHVPSPHGGKLTDGQILDAYNISGNVWKAAELLGTYGQKIHRRLKKIGHKFTKNQKLTKEEKDKIIEWYKTHEKQGELCLVEFAKSLGRCKSKICRFAQKNGLTSRSRGRTKELSDNLNKKLAIYIKENGHPKGFQGHKHSDYAKSIISKNSIEAWQNHSEERKGEIIGKIARIRRKTGMPNNNRENASWKCGWRTIGENKKYYRSRWEANYAMYLEWLKSQGEIIKWEHEPETFWFEGIKRGCLSYLPDFRVIEKNGETTFHEVKGWMDDRSKTVLKRMAKYHPNVKVVLIDKKAYYSIAKTMSHIIKEWERN